MSKIFVYIANKKLTRQLVEGIGNFLGQTYPALYRYPVTAYCPYVEDEVLNTKILGTFFRQRSVKVSAKRRNWHYDSDRAFQDQSGELPEPCKKHIFPCMLQNNLECHDRFYEIYDMNKEILYNH